MAQTRPEGLSPAYSSYVSPDIPDSHYFRWTFRGESTSDYQTKFTIKIYNSKKKALLHTYTKSSSSSEIPFEEIGYDLPFNNDVRYYWNVTTYGKSGKANETSINAWFYYISYPAKPSITWNYIPKPGDVVVSDTYFEEIKQNVSAVVSDYTNATEDMFTDIENLFTEEVVPSRKDFDTLQKVITLLSETLEDSQTKDIEAPVEDSLGVSDLEVIRNHIDMLLTVRPKPMDAISLQIDDPEMYDIYNVDVKNDGKTDPTMDITWKVEGIPNYNGYFAFDKISPSRDVSYYECFYDYGPSDNMFTCQLYYIANAIENGDSNFFDVNWEGLYTPSTIGKARQSFRVFTVDQRGNRSVQKSVVKSFGSNFKAPLGVKYYEVQYQKGKLNSSRPDPKGSWKTVGKPTATKFTHKVSGAEGKVYYRVRAVDLSGLTTSWHYDNGVTFDPLLPPAPPKNFRCTAQTTTTLTFKWDASARAESYEFRAETNQKNLYAGKNRSATGKGLKPATKYDYFVRAKNRAGVSKWVSAVGKTKSSRKTTEKKVLGGRSWRGPYLRNKSQWRTDNNYVYQGEWCEIEGSPHQSGPAGTCWGKHKGMWLFDDDAWRKTLKGKKIISVKLWVHRKSWYHGYYNDQTPTLWLHKYDKYPKGEPSFFAKYKPSAKNFDLGESGWITLPKYYGEYIRDGKAKGIGVYVDKWGRLPYIQFYPNAKLSITYE